MQHLKFGSFEFVARADRTLWHQGSQTLFLSDLHLGKGAHFRQAGIPIPETSETADLDRLIKAITETQVSTVWILGDLFHQPQSITNAQMQRWRNALQALETNFKVILGNHDRQAESFASTLGFSIEPEPTRLHEPAATPTSAWLQAPAEQPTARPFLAPGPPRLPPRPSTQTH